MCDDNLKAAKMYQGRQWGAEEMGEVVAGAAPALGRYSATPDAAPSRRGQSIHKGLFEMKLHHEASLRDITRAITIIDSNPQVLESVEFGEILQRLGLR